jgi:hypothetical protein
VVVELVPACPDADAGWNSKGADVGLKILPRQAPIDLVLPRLAGVVKEKRPNQWMALCPNHADKTPSLSVGVAADGRILLHCFAGCRTTEVVAAIGLALRHLFPFRARRNSAPESVERLTLAQLAAHFRIEPERLRQAEIEECDSGLLIPYFSLDGRRLPKSRIRLALNANPRFKWTGRGSVVPYGLQFLPMYRERGSVLFIVEGESDVWAAWKHSVPAIGIPGATQIRRIKSEYLDGFDRVFLLQEPDRGGENLIAMTPVHFARLDWRGEVLAFRLDAAKDFADLHIQEADRGRFDIRLRDSLLNARKLLLPALRSSKTRTRKRRGWAIDAARCLLGDILNSGQSVPVSSLRKIAAVREIKWPTVRRAAQSMPILKRPSRFQGEWTWQLALKPVSDRATVSLEVGPSGAAIDYSHI